MLHPVDIDRVSPLLWVPDQCSMSPAKPGFDPCTATCTHALNHEWGKQLIVFPCYLHPRLPRIDQDINDCINERIHDARTHGACSQLIWRKQRRPCLLSVGHRLRAVVVNHAINHGAELVEFDLARAIGVDFGHELVKLLVRDMDLHTF